MKDWNQYQRKGLSEMRPYIKGEDMTGISVSEVDDPENDMGMVARNPKNHVDQWYVSRKYFDENLEPGSRPTPVSLEGLKKAFPDWSHIPNVNEWFSKITSGENPYFPTDLNGFMYLVFEAACSLAPHPDTPEPSGEGTAKEIDAILRLVFSAGMTYQAETGIHGDEDRDLAYAEGRGRISALLNPASPPKTEGEG